MADSQGRVNIEVGFSVDKSGLTQMQSLFQQIANKAKEPGAHLSAGLQKAASTANTLDQILEKTFNTELGTLNVTKFNQELSKSGMTLKSIKSDLSAAGNQGATAYNRLTQAILGTNLQIRQSSKLLDSMADTFTKTVKWGIASSVFNNMANAIKKAYTYTKQLDTSLNDIRIVTDKSAENMDRFAEKANAAAKTMGASTLDYTNAALIYYQQGLSDEETAARAETTIKAANVTGQTGKEVSEQLTAVWNGYKVTAAETELYVDKLAAVAATTAADLEELSVGMSKVAAAANAMGVDFDDLNAQIATIVSVTRQAPESVGTALKTIYARLGDLKVDGVDEFGVKLGEVSAQLETMGIQILDQNGDLRDMTSVMAEVAEKWNTWTRAQQQAAAVAMAGKRQYNNLVALFENWDMYSDALETSANAMGTLQHQQDIYMETTEAKLKTLKATWQDLYKGIIDEDELNTGIEALTNLVQVIDNFFDSFGGGIKSISAFGVVVANIFNRQIANAINEASQRQQSYLDNLQILNLKKQKIEEGALPSATGFRGEAMLAATERELAIAKDLYAVRAGLSTEEYNQLTQKQQELGVLIEEEQYQQKILAQGNEIITDQETINNLLSEDNVIVQETYEKQLNIVDEKQKEVQIAQDNINIEKDKLSVLQNNVNEISKYLKTQKGTTQNAQQWGALITNVGKKLEFATEKEKEQVKQILQENESYKVTQNLIDKITAVFDKKVKKAQDNVNIAKEAASIAEDELSIEQQKLGAMDKLIAGRNGILELREKELIIENEINNAMGNAINGTRIVQQVTSITSALGSMAMAWSSIQSLWQTWNDDAASFGDKLTQTFMTLGFTLPMVINNIKKLGEVLNFAAKSQEILSTTLELGTIKTTANTLALAANKLAISDETKAITAKNVATILEITEEEALIAINTGGAASRELLNKVIAKQIVLQKELIALKAKEALASLFTVPGVIIAGLVVATGIIAGISAHYKKLREEAHAAAEESAKLASETRSEVQANQELVEQFEELKDQYDEGAIAKEELWDTTNKLIEAYDLEGSRLDMLTGKYDRVANAIRNQQKAKQEELLKQDEEAVKKAGQDILEQGRKGLNDVSKVGNDYRVRLGNNTIFEEEGDYNKVLSAAQDLFGEEAILNDSLGFSLDNIHFDSSDSAQVSEYINKFQQFAEVLKDAGYEESYFYNNLQDILNGFNEEGALDSFNELQQKTLEDTLDSSTLTFARTQEEFDVEISNLQDILKEKLGKGLIPPGTDPDEAIANYIATINSEFANKFTIEQGLTEKFGSDLNQELVNEFEKLDKSTQLKIVDLFDFSMDSEKGKELLDNYRNYFETQIQAQSALPAGFQVQLNESILKGKDISKEDWETLTNTNPYAEGILGDKDTFNNKSIGERIALMERLNEITRENNILAIEQSDTVRGSGQKVIDDINAQIKALETKSIALDQWASKQTDTEAIDEALQEIQEINAEIEELENSKHEIVLDVDMELATDNLLQSMIGDVITQTDQLISATEAIGEGWKVAAEDVAQFASAFPDLMNEAEMLEDGSLQLSKELINTTLQGNQDIIESNKEVVIDSIDNKIAQLTAEKNFQDEKIKIINEGLHNEQTEEEIVQDLAENTATYKEQLIKDGLVQDAEAAEQMVSHAAQAANGSIQALDELNQAVITLHDNFANAFVKNAQMKSITNQASGIINIAAGDISEHTNSNLSDEFKERLEAELRDAELRSSEIEQEIASYYGLRSEILSKASQAGAAAERVKSGKAGKEDKSKSGGSGKDKKDKDTKELKDEFDRYWDIKKAIDAVDRAISKLDKDQENLYGYELIKSLKLENQLLEQQAGNYKALAEAQKQEAAELQGVLSGYGVAFDASGAITNYAAATAAALQQYNDAIHQYNMGLIDESTLGVFEKNYEKFKKALERYDTLFYTEMKETEEKLDEIRRKELANNLKAWQVEIELKLNMKELERQWNDFITKVQKDFQKVYGDLRVDLRNMLKDAYTYTGSEGTIATIIKAIQDVTGEIDKMRFGGTSDMFESISQAQEELKKLNDQLLEAGEALHDLWEQAWDNYLDGIDQVADQFDDLIDRFERINDELDFQGKLIELIYGEEAYGLMDKLYKGQEKNTLAQIDSLKQQRDMWEQLFYASGATLENQTEWDEDQKKYYDEWMEAQSDLNNLVLDYIELLKTDYLNTVKDVLKQFDAFVSGSSLAHLGDQWDRIADRADKYYDSVEGAYEVQSLANKMDQSIANETNLKTQQKLQALRDKEIQYLREKENLTEYDLQAAEARFQIALKEAALEDARNNKTSMKLTRNEQGNWSYQYIADEGDVADKQQDLLDSFNQLYQLASDAYKANLEALLNLQQTYKEKTLEIIEDGNLSTQEKLEYLDELYKWYLEEYKLLEEENTLYRNDLKEGAAALLLEIYKQDQTAYQYMTETERALLDELLAAHVDGFLDLEDKLSTNYQNIGNKAAEVMEATRADWTSGAQTIADLWNGDNGFSVKVQVLQAYETINEASIRYKELVDQVAIAVGRDFSEEGIAGAIMRAEQETDNLSSKTVDLVNTSITYLNQLRAYVDQIAAAWRSVQQAIMDAIGLIQEYLKYIGDVNAAAASGGVSGGGGETTSPNRGNNGNNDLDNGSRQPGNTKRQYYIVHTGDGRTHTVGSYEEAKRVLHNAGQYGGSISGPFESVNESGNIGFATGGYTGEWNNGSTEGRLAMLHQKELVLNETDTSNFLKGINTLRDMSSENGSIERAILKSVANVALNLGNLKPGNVQGGSTTTNDTSNIFNIQAEFPNANNVNDIKEAILSLPNLASQRVNLNLK